MAVDTNEACTLMNVRFQVVKLNAIGSEKSFTGGVWRTIFFIEVVLKIAVIIESDPVTVMAREAGCIFWTSLELMRDHGTVIVFEVTGTASGCPPGQREIISGMINMTPHALSFKRILKEFSSRRWFGITVYLIRLYRFFIITWENQCCI